MKNAIFTFFLINLAIGLFAQTDDSIHFSQVIDELEVSAPRWVSATHNQSAYTASLKKGEIAAKLIQTSADMLNFSKGVFIQKSQQGGGSPMIRGYSANRLLYIVDGVRMNTAIFRSGNLQNVISIDPYSLERADVIFGPTSVQYGSDALGGIMSFNTLRPQLNKDDSSLKFDGRAVAKASTGNNEITGHVDFNLYNDKWSWVSSVTYSDYGDIVSGGKGRTDYRRPWYVVRENNTDVKKDNENDKVLVPSGYTQWNVLQKLKFQPSKNVDFEFIYQNSQSTAFDRYDRLVATRNGNPRFGEWKYGPQKWQSFVLESEFKSENFLYDIMTFSAAYQQFEESRITRNFRNNERQTRTENVDAYSTNIDFSKRLSSKNTLWYGAEWVFNKVLSTGIDENIVSGANAAGPPRYPNSNWSSLAAYVTGEYAISTPLALSYGLRYNSIGLKSKFENDFYGLPYESFEDKNNDVSYSLGLVYQANKKSKFALTVSKGFRAPNVDDAGKIFESTPGFVIVPNTTLVPEKAYNLELNGIFRISEKLQFDVTAFYSYLDDAMVRRNASFNGQDSILFDGVLSRVQAVQNAAFAKVGGIFSTIEYRPTSNLKAFANFNYQKGIEETENGATSPLRHSPPIFGMAGIEYTKNKLSLGLNAFYNGEVKHEDLPLEEIVKTDIYAKDDNGETFSPAWTTLNFRASYSPIKSVSIQVGVDNIADLAYKTYASGIAAQGRSFILALNYQW